MARRNALAGDWEILGDDLDSILTMGDDRFIAGDDDSAEAMIKGRRGVILRQKQPTKARRFPIGFESDGPVAAGGSANITSRPQVLFRGERLAIPSDIAGDFVVEDLKVGKDSQLVAPGALPGRVFQEDAIDVQFQLDTNQISQDLTLSVMNVSGAARQFRAALVGSVVEV